jgi:hypothetical protein
VKAYPCHDAVVSGYFMLFNVGNYRADQNNDREKTHDKGEGMHCKKKLIINN